MAPHAAGDDMDVSEKVTTQTLAKFDGYEPKAVLTYCPSCHAHMDHTFAETGISMDAPYLHVTEFIVDNLHTDVVQA